MPSATARLTHPDRSSTSVVKVRTVPTRLASSGITLVALPAWIVFPTFARDAAPRLTRLPRARAFFKLADCSFNYESLGLRGFTTLSRMIDGCDAYEFTYSSLEDALSLLGALPLP